MSRIVRVQLHEAIAIFNRTDKTFNTDANHKDFTFKHNAGDSYITVRRTGFLRVTKIPLAHIACWEEEELAAPAAVPVIKGPARP